MGFLDSPDLLDNLKLLKEQYPAIAGLLGSLEPSEKDKKQAMTNALLTAGAGILAANNGRGPPMGAIGQGLLGGIQGYQQNIADQRKDAMQRVSTIGGLLGLGQNLQKAQLYQDLMGGGSQTAPAPQQTAGDLGAMSSVGGGNELGGMAPSQPVASAPQAAIRAPSAIQPLMNQLQQAGVPDFVIKANLANGPTDGFKGITDLWKEVSRPENLRQGGGLYSRTGTQIVQAPVIPQGQYYIPGQGGGPGVAVPISGATQGMESNARATAAGSAQGKSPFEGTQMPLTSGGTTETTVQIANVARQFNLPVGAARDMVNSYPEQQWPIFAKAYRAAMPVGGSAQVAPNGEVTVNGPGDRPGELYGQPNPVQQEAAKAKAVSEATLQTRISEGAQKQAIDLQLASLNTDADKLRPMVDTALPGAFAVKKALSSGAITGGLAEQKTQLLNLLNGILPEGAQINPALLNDTQALNAALKQGVAAQAKSFGSQPSNYEDKIIGQAAGDQGLTAKTLELITDRKIKLMHGQIDRQNQMAENARKNGAIDIAGRWTLPKPTYEEWSQNIDQSPGIGPAVPTTPQPKVSGKTLDYHIQNILQNGTPEQKQKLRAAGYLQ